MADKYDFLKEKWNGWRYGLIETIDEFHGRVINIHECYQSDNGSISWTENPVGVDGFDYDPKAIEKRLKAIENDIVGNMRKKIWFTEQELLDYNNSLEGKWQIPNTTKGPHDAT